LTEQVRVCRQWSQGISSVIRLVAAEAQHRSSRCVVVAVFTPATVFPWVCNLVERTRLTLPVAIDRRAYARQTLPRRAERISFARSASSLVQVGLFAGRAPTTLQSVGTHLHLQTLGACQRVFRVQTGVARVAGMLVTPAHLCMKVQ
jgi:hypothetical protein